MSIKIAYWIVMCACLLSVSCGGSGLSRSEAANLIPNSQEFSEAREENFQIGLVNAFAADELSSQQPYTALSSLGYIVISADGGASIVSLTDKGRQEAANWEQFYWMGRNSYKIQVANREVVEVTGISEPESEGNIAQATFTWRWKPTNEVGRAMAVDKQTYNGNATFEKFDDGWRVGMVSGDGIMP